MHLPVHNTRETPFFFRCSFPTQGHRAAGLPSGRQRSASCQQSPPPRGTCTNHGRSEGAEARWQPGLRCPPQPGCSPPASHLPRASGTRPPRAPFPEHRAPPPHCGGDRTPLSPTAAQRSPNGRRARSLRSPPRPPDGAARAASARPATRCVTAHGPASPHPPSLPRSPRAAPPQGGACAGRGLCPCTTPPCWGGGLRARTRGVEGALRGPGRLCGWGWDWMVLRAPSSPSPSLKSRSYSRKHLL